MFPLHKGINAEQGSESPSLSQRLD